MHTPGGFKRPIIAAIMVCAALASADAFGKPVAPAASAQASFGINAQFLFSLLPESEWAFHATKMRQAGIQLVRVDAPWSDAEPAPPDAVGHHHFKWDELDAIAGTLAAARLRWLPLIDYSSWWDASYTNGGGDPRLSPPRHPLLFAAYARALVQRYGPGGTFWRQRPDLPRLSVDAVEVWNEENLAAFWQPLPDPAAYLRLYEAARSSIHAIAPSVEVLVGGLANPATDFLDEMYRAGRQQNRLFDGVAIHPYDGSAGAVIDDVTAARAVLDTHGDVDVPLDITEVGWPTRGAPPASGIPVLTDAQRASDLSALTSTLARADCGVERILPHTWVTLERDPNDAEDWFGLVHPSGALSLSADIYSAIIRSFERRPERDATLATCDRELSVTASKRPQQHRRHRFTACTAATVTSDGVPIDRATVRFRLVGPHGRPVASVSRGSALTGRSGRAVDCVRSSHPTRGVLRLIASRPDFAVHAIAELPVVLHG